MTNKELIDATLNISVETGSLACLGCGHEHSCGTRGCAILRQAADRLVTLERQERAAVNELCQRCGKYRMAHKGACDGCRFYGKEDEAKDRGM